MAIMKMYVAFCCDTFAYRSSFLLAASHTAFGGWLLPVDAYKRLGDVVNDSTATTCTTATSTRKSATRALRQPP